MKINVQLNAEYDTADDSLQITVDPEKKAQKMTPLMPSLIAELDENGNIVAFQFLKFAALRTGKVISPKIL
jgi:uncharacterized protein YuzE